jgi:hypothetical protein
MRALLWGLRIFYREERLKCRTLALPGLGALGLLQSDEAVKTI